MSPTNLPTIYIQARVASWYSLKFTILVGRVDYVLRAINVKAGQHKVVLTFKPQSVRDTETVAYIAFTLLIIAVLGGVYYEERKKRMAAKAKSEALAEVKVEDEKMVK